MTQQSNMLTINLGDPSGPRQVSASEALHIIRENLNMSRYALAASISIEITKQLPDEIWPHLNAAASLLMNQQIEPAFQYINRALDIDPNNADCLIIKSRIHLNAGDREQAVQIMRLAVSLVPENSYLHYEMGELLTETGNIDEARKSFLSSIEFNSRNVKSLLGLSRLPGDNYSDELIKTVEFIAQSHQLHGEEQIKAHFALAHAYEKKDEVTQQFIHLNAGNKLMSHILKYDPASSTAEAQQITEFFSEEFFMRRRPEKGNPAPVIFIIGFPRCGSTLVEQILCSHPSVSGAGELLALQQAIINYQQSRNLSRGYPYWVDSQPVGQLTLIADDYMRIVRKFNQSTCMTDKQLPNYRFAGLIHLIFPNAKIINVQRNPIDVCYSCYKRLFKLNSLPYMYDLEHLASRYRDYQQVIKHWNEVLPGKVHTVEYEQLINQQEEVTRSLLEYCELPWDDACMNFHKNRRTVHTHSSTQVRQRLYTDSIDRWKAYEDYLGPLLDLTNNGSQRSI